MGRKTTVWILQATNCRDLYEKINSWLRKAKFKRKTESLPIATQNNAIKTMYIKAKIDNTQQNGKCRL